eukprot:365390-Chlamydomonas_euryale.AAC.26
MREAGGRRGATHDWPIRRRAGGGPPHIAATSRRCGEERETTARPGVDPRTCPASHHHIPRPRADASVIPQTALPPLTAAAPLHDDRLQAQRSPRVHGA